MIGGSARPESNHHDYSEYVKLRMNEVVMLKDYPYTKGSSYPAWWFSEIWGNVWKPKPVIGEKVGLGCRKMQAILPGNRTGISHEYLMVCLDRVISLSTHASSGIDIKMAMKSQKPCL